MLKPHSHSRCTRLSSSMNRDVALYLPRAIIPEGASSEGNINSTGAGVGAYEPIMCDCVSTLSPERLTTVLKRSPRTVSRCTRNRTRRLYSEPSLIVIDEFFIASTPSGVEKSNAIGSRPSAMKPNSSMITTRVSFGSMGAAAAAPARSCAFQRFRASSSASLVSSSSTETLAPTRYPVSFSSMSSSPPAALPAAACCSGSAIK
eukprot:Amastigsp_a346178_113.p3 type:complete len:204 gc:universal Amastigsp_a346178_113:636-25(-)